jgi:hypothetical protein
VRNSNDKIRSINRNWYYHQNLINFYKFNISPNSSILNIHDGIDYYSKSLNPQNYKSINILENENLPSEKFDFIIIADTLSLVPDIQTLFHRLKILVKPQTRIIINYHNYLWRPLIRFAEKIGIKSPQNRTNWLTTEDIVNLLEIENFQIIKIGKRLLFPFYIPLISYIINKYFANLPLINSLCFVNFLISRQLPKSKTNTDQTVSIVIPARNEEKNIENAIKRLPPFGKHQEIIFVEGHSKDNTWKTIKQIKRKYHDMDIKYLKQEGKGKADAVRKGFSVARGNILMILDADLTVSPKELPKFYNAIVNGKGEYINGSRLVYPMEKQAMQFLNILGNYFFSVAFSWILSQKIKDTLCGTKVLSRENYNKIKQNRSYFGDFDPFGDYDLIFGASKLNLKFIEIPIHYKAREYGQTNISRFQHGFLLLKMTFFALNKIKFIS